jgi:DNA-binding NtrC family response regulator
MTNAPSTLELAHDGHDARHAHGAQGAQAGPLALLVSPLGGRPRRHPLPADGSVVLGGAWAVGGSDDDARIAIDDPAISARHARIEVARGRARLVDLGSRNGTWLGGARVVEAALPPGVCAILGHSTIALEAAAAGDEGARAGAVDADGPDDEGEPLPGAIGRSAEMRALARTVRAFAPLSAPVLVRGESGSGKELVARALHLLSPRASGPFHAQNLGALPRELAEGELFGHERGAFTGAIAARPGLFELADGGTLFLDELGELPLEMQAKLLRVLEMGEVRRIGARAAKRVDVRVVAATWAPLEARVAEGTFREDLYHRVAVLVLDVPPLRARRTDIVPIAEAMLATARRDFGPKRLSAGAASRLQSEPWPGNVRELRNVVYRAGAGASGPVIEVADVARAMLGRAPSAPPPRNVIDTRTAIELVGAHGGNVTKAARAAGVARETLRDWVRAARRSDQRGVAAR